MIFVSALVAQMQECLKERLKIIHLRYCNGRKPSWKDEYLKWICGFANAQGGKIYIGCNDDGQVVGVMDSKKLLEDIPNKITQSLGIVADVNLLTENEREYIEIVVPAYTTGITY